jgi:hypothetical protein
MINSCIRELTLGSLKTQVKYWKYPWPNLWQTKSLIVHTGPGAVLIILFPLMVVATWEIHMVRMVAAVLHTTRSAKLNKHSDVQNTYLQDCNVSFYIINTILLAANDIW